MTLDCVSGGSFSPKLHNEAECYCVEKKMGVGGLCGLCGYSFFVVNSNS